MLGRIIQDRLLAAPERIWCRFVSDDGEFALSQGALCGMASDAARRIEALDLPPRSIIGIAQYSGPALHAAWLGALWYGHIPAMLSPPSPRMETAKYVSGLTGIVGGLKLQAVIVDAQSAANMRHLMTDVTLVEAANFDPAAQLYTAAVIGANDVAILQHSSGTTGQQKAIALTAAEILSHQRAFGERIELSESDKIVSWLPLYHDMGFIAAFLQPLVIGLELIEMSPFSWASRPAMLLEAISRHRPTLCWLPNFAFSVLSEPRVLRSLSGIDLSSIRMWINSAEPVMAGSIDRFVQALTTFGVAQEAIAASYGMAENVLAITQTKPGKLSLMTVDREQLETSGTVTEAAAGEARHVTLVSNGSPLASTQVEVRSEHGVPLGQCTIGEFHIRGDHRISGYHNRPELTGGRLDPADWFATGDLGFIKDDEIYVTGRKKDLLILRGRNYLAQEIEEAIGALPGVRPGRVAAFSLPDPLLGTERLIILAEAEADYQSGPLSLAIRQCVAQTFDTTISDLKIVPDRWLIKSTSGKLGRKDNRAKYLAEFGS
jgi:fatty-acyl-CoA synthase